MKRAIFDARLLVPTMVFALAVPLGMWVLAAPAAGCSGSTHEVSGPPRPPPVTGAAMTAANRTAGVAPLLVFFDAVDVGGAGVAQSSPASPWPWTSGVVQPAGGDPLRYEATLYEWDFGDPGSGSWTVGSGTSKNSATGYTAAHVFETPGSYTVALKVTDTAGVVNSYLQTITVTAFAGSTYYVAATGADSNPGTQALPFLTASKGMAMAGANKAVLFRRGDSFTLGATTLSGNGPAIVGAYGTGERPSITTTAPGGGSGEPAITLAGSDWRVMDLDLHGTGWSALSFRGNLHTEYNLLMRLRANFGTSSYSIGFGVGTDTSSIGVHYGFGFVECESISPSVNGMYVEGRHMAIMGNYIHDLPTSHVLRVPQAHHACIVGNRLLKAGLTRHSLKLHSRIATDGWQGWTQFVTISDNQLSGSYFAASIGPEDSISDERVSHVVYERNTHLPDGTVQQDLETSAQQLVARNNVFVATGNTYYTAIFVGRRGVEPAPQDVRILNNTIYKGNANNEFTAIAIDAGVPNAAVCNNLAQAPAGSTGGIRAMVTGGGGAGWVGSNNLLTTDAGLTNPAAGDFSLTAASVAVDAGTARPDVPQDFLRAARPKGAAYDLGAFESR